VQQIQNGAHIANDVLESELHSIKSDLAYIEHETSFPQEAGQAWAKANST